MTSVQYVGLDVHKESITIRSYNHTSESMSQSVTVDHDYKKIVKYIEQLRKGTEGEAQIVCGYEAGCTGYALYHQLTNSGVKCVILAPSTMMIVNKSGKKNDRRDAANIAKCLAFGTYSEVHVPTKEDEDVREYIRMRDSQKKALKITKQQILALLLRQGWRYTQGKNNWTQMHLVWLRSLDLGGVLQETLTEYLIEYERLTSKIERMDHRIEELAGGERYRENVKKLTCLMGVRTHTALSVMVEVGDFKRFATSERLASFLGLVPGEDSSGARQRNTGITKAGNSHVRRLLIESAQSYTRGMIGFKSKDLKRRQQGNTPEVIAYADRANERLRRKYYHMVLHNHTHRNVAITAIARELACFIWGMMTDHIA